jgi:hypothetical protein
MGLKCASTFVVSALLLAWAGSAAADDQYRAGEFLTLDLSKAALSPKRIGPPAQFAPVAVEARNDAEQKRPEAKVVRTTVVRATNEKQARAEKPRAPARAKVVRRQGNPLDAQARDTRIQKWPCTSGGICEWKR